MKIIMRNKKDKLWKLVETAAYSNEAELQQLLSESPGLISIKDVRENATPLVFAVREFSLPIGSIDLVAFSAAGEIAVVECKLASNPEIKRKVIGQVLEYGANLWRMSYEDLNHGVQLRTGESLAEQMEKVVEPQEWDEEEFRSAVQATLNNGNFILIIVVDEINEELARIVRFMNIGGNQDYAFAALEMRRFQHESAEMLIPRFFGPVHSVKSAPASPKRKWNEADFFAELAQRHDEQAVKVARRILEWAKQTTQVWWGEGKRDGSFVPYIMHQDTKQQLFAVWTYGMLEIYFYWYQYKRPFDDKEKRIELLNMLNQIEGVNLSPDDVNRRPSIKLDVFADEAKLNRLLEVYNWVLDEIRRQ